jgi:diketogulonate reductase-like aldo/keto reductase
MRRPWPWVFAVVLVTLQIVWSQLKAFAVNGVSVPWILYGTAWKEERTTALTAMALTAGFRGIDTANQRKHYFEEGVGEALAGSDVPRESLFLQTKFTYARGQDHRLPYDPRADLPSQVRQSFARSLEHLRATTLDAYLLHGPERGRGVTAGDFEVWRTFESLHREGRVRLIGVSNVSLEQLKALHRDAEVKPALVQNRCYARDGWDHEVRAFCRDHGILYEGFSLLTANSRELAQRPAQRVAQRAGRSMAEVVFAFAHAVGMVVLTGTTSEEHMRVDLDAWTLSLDAADIRTLERLAP